MKEFQIVLALLSLVLVFVPSNLLAQTGNAINFQNATFNSHGDFVYCGQPDYGFTDKMTVTAWVKWTTDPGNWAVSNHNEREGQYATYVAYATHNTLNVSTEHGLFWLRNAKTGNKIQFTVENVSGTKVTVSSTFSPSSNTWYYIAGTYDGSNVKLYINGDLQGTTALTGYIRANTDCRLNMGRLPWGYGFFVGYMDEVRIWNVALSQSDIQTQMTSTATVQDANCKSYWNFNENSGTSITDSKGLANGTFYSALIDVHSYSTTPSVTITDEDRTFVTGAWNGKTLKTVAGAGVDETNTINANTGNVFILSSSCTTPPVLDGTTNMTWFGVLDPNETSQWVESFVPVELTSLNAKVFNTNAILTWRTATEVNNYGFEIERRKVASTEWKKIAFVQGAGTSNSPKEYSFTDSKVPAGHYEYRLKQIDLDGSFKYSQSVEVEVGNLPTEFTLYQNYPNPFNPNTTIRYDIPNVGTQYIVSLRVYDILGKEVATLVNAEQPAGSYEVKFDASKLASGVYFYKLATGNFISVKKIVLMK